MTAAHDATAPESGGSLRRQLGLADAIAIYIGIVLGSGIFVAPAAVARAAPGPLGAAGLWLAGGIVAACGGLCYAECGARLPQAGGFFVFYKTAFGDSLAFVAGWAALLVTYPAAIAAIAHVFADYMAEIVPGLGPRTTAVTAAAVLVAGTVNALGVRLSAWTQRILTSAKFLALVALLVAAWLGGGQARAASTPVAAHGSSLASLVLTAAVVIMWTYDGWSDGPLLAGELRDPARTLGRTIVIGTTLLVVLYIGVQLAVSRLLPADVAASSTRVVADAVEAGLGPRASRLVALLIVVTTGASVNACIFTASRIAYAMSRGGALPAWFGAASGRSATPRRSVLALVAVTTLYAVAGTFDALLAFFSFSVWIFYALTAGALLELRRRGVGEPLAWRAPLGPVPVIVVLLTAAFMTQGLMRDDPRHSLIGLGILLLGFPAFFAWRRLARGGRPAGS
jgi:APA family basic amino acid/polyamine antiporter